MSTLKIGVVVPLTADPQAEMKKVADLGLASCQVTSWTPGAWTDEAGNELIAAADGCGVEISAFWAGYTGPCVWDFIDGPATIGLVPPEFRSRRVEELKRAARFAAKFNLPAIVTHVGFIPDDPNDPKFDGTVEALKLIAGSCAELGVEFWFETGQETPVTLLRTIERVATGNLGINLDAGNLILYGKANPVDSLDVFGRYVRGVHAKDGLYPTDGTSLGREAPLGEGKVDFPALIGRLKELGFAGALTIEREISGDQQIEDIRKGIELLRPLC